MSVCLHTGTEAPNELNKPADSGKSVSTISYAVDGKQYICVKTGDNPKVPEMNTEFPEIKTPRSHNAIYVFTLP